jgi:hypothetical protein
MVMYSLVHVKQLDSFPMSLVKGKICLPRGSFVGQSLEGLVVIGVPATEAMVMSNYSRMDVLYCPWLM